MDRKVRVFFVREVSRFFKLKQTVLIFALSERGHLKKKIEFPTLKHNYTVPKICYFYKVGKDTYLLDKFHKQTCIERAAPKKKLLRRDYF